MIDLPIHQFHKVNYYFSDEQLVHLNLSHFIDPQLKTCNPSNPEQLTLECQLPCIMSYNGGVMKFDIIYVDLRLEKYRKQ